MVRLAFAGFRHGHIMGLYNAARQYPRTSVVAACEEDRATAAVLREQKKVELTHDNFRDMLQAVECDAIAIGDYFAKRGSLIIESLKAGKHVICDKPICTDLQELDQISRMAKEKKRAVGCQLDLREHGPFRTMRRLIRSGTIGDVHTVAFSAQHPLFPGTRPAWYFEQGKHGGTLNDIAVHGVDLIPWMTGRTITEVVAARAWNARLKQHPHFQDAGQMLLKMDNGGGIFGDVSYLAPDGLSYNVPQYWRITCHGSGGVIETSYNSDTISLAQSGDKVLQVLPSDPSVPQVTLESFLDEIEGRTSQGALTTADVLDASRKSLLIQEAADRNLCHVSL